MVKTLEKMNADFNDQSTDTEMLQNDVLSIAGFSRYAGNLNDNWIWVKFLDTIT